MTNPIPKVDQSLSKQLSWESLYSESFLLQAALQTYAKSLFRWQRSFCVSHDNQSLQEFARFGGRRIKSLHKKLVAKDFQFKPALAKHYNFKGKKRVFYIPPWEERLVDTLLYQILTPQLEDWFSSSSYAYRSKKFSLDLCQRNIAAALKKNSHPFVLKRDIADFFSSVSHAVLLRQLGRLIPENDFLYSLLRQRVEHEYLDKNTLCKADRGLPFGCASSCLLANIHLTQLDKKLESISEIVFFRYSDDLLILCPNQDVAAHVDHVLTTTLQDLQLTWQDKRSLSLYFSASDQAHPAETKSTDRFKHLGLEFRANGVNGLSTDKMRKLQNIFRYAWRRHKKRLARIQDTSSRARLITKVASQVIEEGIRHVAIIDYYLKHTEDMLQLKALDLWLAEQSLALVFGSHRKGNFKKMSFARLRQLGLPSLQHRARLIRHKKIDAPFFLWKVKRQERAQRRGWPGF